VTGIPEDFVRKFVNQLVEKSIIEKVNTPDGPGRPRSVYVAIDQVFLKRLAVDQELTSSFFWSKETPDEAESNEPELEDEIAPSPESVSSDPFELMVAVMERLDSKLDRLQGAVVELTAAVATQNAQRDSLVIDELIKLTDAVKALAARPQGGLSEDMFQQLTKEMQEDRVVLSGALAKMQEKLVTVAATTEASAEIVEDLRVANDVHVGKIIKAFDAATLSHKGWTEAMRELKSSLTDELDKLIVGIAAVARDNTENILRAVSLLSRGEEFIVRMKSDALTAKNKKDKKSLPKLSEMVVKKDDEKLAAVIGEHLDEVMALQNTPPNILKTFKGALDSGYLQGVGPRSIKEISQVIGSILEPKEE
jgi:hypothetical protein